MEKRTNSLLQTLKLKWKTEKLKGSYPIHMSNKLSNSRLILEVSKLEVSKNYGEFTLILNQIKTNGQSKVFTTYGFSSTNRESKCHDERKSENKII